MTTVLFTSAGVIAGGYLGYVLRDLSDGLRGLAIVIRAVVGPPAPEAVSVALRAAQNDDDEPGIERGRE